MHTTRVRAPEAYGWDASATDPTTGEVLGWEQRSALAQQEAGANAGAPPGLVLEPDAGNNTAALLPDEVMGDDDATGASSTEADGVSDEEDALVTPIEIPDCTLCLQRRSTHAFVPCGHLCMCHRCASLSGNMCPMCRSPASGVLHVIA